MNKKMAEKTISFIGGGRVAWLMIRRLKDLEEFGGKIIVSDPNMSCLQKIEAINYPRLTTTSDNHIAAEADLIFLAVHRPAMAEVIPDIRKYIQKKSVIVSLLPTVTSGFLQRETGAKRIIRMIPNAPSLIGKGFNPVFLPDDFSVKEKEEFEWLFSQWGESPEVQEKELEAYALLTGMGPTYFWFQWLELKKLAGKFGLTVDASGKAIHKMVNASNELLFESGLSEEEVLDLIPVYPMKDDEKTISELFDKKLFAMFSKLKGMTE